MVVDVDPVPLGVSGNVTLPLSDYLARLGNAPRPQVLLDDVQRVEYLVRRIAAAIDHPLTMPGSQQVARQVMNYFDEVDLMPHFAVKILETLRDGNRHDRLLISAMSPRLAISFVAWNGSHREVQAERIGTYLSGMLNIGKLLANRGVLITGLLEIDAYVRDNADPDAPALPLDDVFEIDLEYSYMPGFLLDNPDEEGPLPPMVFLNPGLCLPEEAQALRKLMSR